MSKEMSNPPTNQKHQSTVAYTVEQLIAVNPYNPDILPDLENYVNEQVSSQTYSLDANLCLLRLYQFEPARMSTQIVVRILIKALMATPAPDFSLCLFLIPERVQMEEQFKTLIVLSNYLEAINIEGPSLDKIIDYHTANSGWQFEKKEKTGPLIILPCNEFNHPQLKKSASNGVPLDKIARIIPILG
ncbi:Eukaryotic translation initiation factor 3 subunit K [Striga hermonthica]|uniref:Eukaryotic translation initiation factor 3 subunit K n=1 Tax=Striga hermonthica TaxID=68872 RepID=A0A9N7NBN8_STRHE|nr:Eukaryotic translation initiation factor 3 subunit K [Striga hermonthica]